MIVSFRAILRALLMACVTLMAATVVAQEALPRVMLAYDTASFNSQTFIPATFTLTADGVIQHEGCCTVRHRGATSLFYDKPNIAVKMIDETGNSEDVKLLDMRKDNYWILDAMASDCGKVRNRVAMDLWLDTSRPPYHQAQEPKAVNGYRGRYVEVWVNNEYEGLYCLMERVDRKQLKLRKFVPATTEVDADGNEHPVAAYYRGLLYKGVNGTGTRTPYLLYQTRSASDLSASYDGMQCEYPDVKEGEPWSWKPLCDNIYRMATTSSHTFGQRMKEDFDLPVFVDYVLFLDLLYATDNVGKNTFYWFYDKSSADNRLGITPWDLDSTWGRDYLSRRQSSQSELKNKTNFDSRMSLRYAGYADTLATRYAELRDSMWSENALLKRFEVYFDLLESSGAWQRDRERWQNTNVKLSDLNTERQYLTQWIHDRLAFLDDVYGYAETLAIEPVRVAALPQPTNSYDLMGRPMCGQNGLCITREGVKVIR